MLQAQRSDSRVQDRGAQPPAPAPVIGRHAEAERSRSLASWLGLAYAVSAMLAVLAAERLLSIALDDVVAEVTPGYLGNLAFVAATTLLVYLALRFGLRRIDRGASTAEARGDADEAASSHEAALVSGWKAFVLVFAVLLTAFAATASYVYLRQETLALELGKARIESIAELKAGQVRRWLDERQRSLEMLASNPEFIDRAVRSFDPGAASTAARDQVLERLETLVDVHGYIGATLFDARQVARVVVRASAQGAGGCEPQLVARSIAAESPAVGGLNVEATNNGVPRLELIVALMRIGSGVASMPAKPPAGALCALIDPLRELFPIVLSQFAGFRTSETHLVRIDGGTVTYLTGLGGAARTPMQLERAAAREALLSGGLPRGQVAAESDTSQRGRYGKVLVAVHPVRSTPWAIVSSIDREELLLRQRELALWSGAMVAAFVAVATAGSMLVARHQGLRLLSSARRRNARWSLRERQFGMIARHANDIILLMDDRGVILEANERAASDYGYTLEELRGMHATDLRADEHTDSFDAQWSGVDAEHGAVFEARQRRKDGTTFPVEMSVRMMEVDGVRYRHAIVRDLSERHQLSERLRFLARHDELTGLPNRSAFNDALDAALARARRNNGEVAVMFVDLDDFKAVNDTAGHAAGDAVLQEFARRLTTNLRETDFVARLGGDEFCVVMEFSPAHSNVELVARKILAAVAVEFRVDEGSFRLGASIGVSRFPGDGDRPGTLLKCADTAMYEAKLSGKNAYRFYHSG